jgi:hypothetical protein
MALLLMDLTLLAQLLFDEVVDGQDTGCLWA